MSKPKKVILSVITACALMITGMIAPAQARANAADFTVPLGGTCVINVTQLRVEGNCVPQFIGGALIAGLAALGLGLTGSLGSNGGSVSPTPAPPDPTTPVPTTPVTTVPTTTNNPEPTTTVPTTTGTSEPTTTVPTTTVSSEPTTTVPTTTVTPIPDSNKIMIYRTCMGGQAGWARAVPMFSPEPGDTMRLYVNGVFSVESTTDDNGSLIADDMTIGSGPVTIKAVTTMALGTFEREESFAACP